MSFREENTEWLPLSALTIDRRVQRQAVHPGHVKRIAENFDPSAFGSLKVSRRSDGVIVVLDGQHRMAALKALGFNGDQKVPCDVRDGLTLEQEARYFRLLNTAQKPGSVDRFLVRTFEGDPVANDVLKIATDHGWKIGKGGGNVISAVDAMESVYTGARSRYGDGDDPDALVSTLATITQAWGHNSHGVIASIIGGIGNVYRRDGKRVDMDAMARRLAALDGGPDGLIGRGRSVTSGSRRGVQEGISWVIVGLHNKGRRSRILDPWPV